VEIKPAGSTDNKSPVDLCILCPASFFALHNEAEDCSDEYGESVTKRIPRKVKNVVYGRFVRLAHW